MTETIDKQKQILESDILILIYMLLCLCKFYREIDVCEMRSLVDCLWEAKIILSGELPKSR